jgi:hypothetical protein
MNKFLKGAVVTAIAFSGSFLTLAGAFAQDDGLDREVFLNNRSDSTIVAFYASNVGTNSWEENILDGNEVDPGYRVHINLDDGSGYCRFDVKTVFADGTYVVRHDVNVCAVRDYTIYN